MSEQLTHYQHRFNTYAQSHLPNNPHHLGEVYAAIHYAFKAGGKRLRPALVYAMAESLHLPLTQVDDLAFAVECTHTYSLIHDDLPAMDDDDMRRGIPSCHKQFDEGTAILAGDALNTLAFEVLSRTSNTSAQIRIQQIHCLATCAGIAGMVGGQDSDLFCENRENCISREELTLLHQRKTAKLIEAALLLPYFMLEETSKDKQSLLSSAALSLGLFYQIQDDILDATQTSEILGKPGGSDSDNNKSTYVSLLGIDGAKQAADSTAEQAIARLSDFFAPNTHYDDTPLATIIEQILVRKY